MGGGLMKIGVWGGEIEGEDVVVWKLEGKRE